MGKHDAPLFKMLIEGGRLVPATAFDAERLDSYRRGTRVNVRLTEEKDRVLVRKWWAVLGLVVKQCDVPWTNKEQASEAIKLALGIVNLTKTVGGKFMQYPKSLTELDDPELQEAVDQMMALIERMTGIDPDTLRKEAADVGADEHEISSDAPSSDENGSGDPAPQNAAAGESSSQESGQSEEAGGDNAPALEPADPVTTELMRECVDNMLRAATEDEKAKREERTSAAYTAWLKELPAHEAFVKRVFETCCRLLEDPSNVDTARKYLMAKVA
ncbi:hypothetical protein [Aliihoeflea sp. 2WW]|uniref:hypothetical protein n=1 Tax=Aliihoeflea sp. 2WW TaxID=1381123 RepID=UPI000464B174|nr:hypothetical protein [Aliihoeflea sp. 2WW]